MTRRRFPHRPQRSAKKYIHFLVVAVVLIFVVDYFFWKDGRPYMNDIIEGHESSMPELEPIIVSPENGAEYFSADMADYVPEIPAEVQAVKEAPAEIIEEPAFTEEGDDLFIEDFFWDGDVSEPPAAIPLIPEGEVEPIIEPTDKQSSAPVKFKGKIAIVIDDMGMNLKQSRAAIGLPSEVTLAFLPYAAQVQPLSSKAKGEGHELIIHAPMEAMNADVPLGGMALRAEMDHQQFQNEFNKMAQSFDGYVGVNNHMGSKLTQIPEHMAYLMEQLKNKDLYFLDSRTIHTSIAAEMAAAYGVPTIKRDIFLDHEEGLEYVTDALTRVERMAARNGTAVAIGHPKQNTMKALKRWIPSLQQKGFELVPLSELIEKNKKTALKTQ